MNNPDILNGVHSNADSLTLQWADGRTSHFAAIWLRDNQSEQRDAHSGQRLIDIADSPAAPKIRSASLHAGAVQVQWENESHPATFDVGWLAAQSDTPFEHVPMQPWIGGALDASRDFAWLRLREARENAADRSHWRFRIRHQFLESRDGSIQAGGSAREVKSQVHVRPFFARLSWLF